ncbi:uncharacterized protein LOC126902014 [Daktulosphaira vitifoliae]|uniref:uncharacterized protein LOC126902014 n=1 Tax=Daktulosphaira vitifoliae TaxID=58002 RepID=UPI0021A9D2F3|nr:uncharacterized protein LOC126902014 [Daktulosphaira vitifoliae]
MNQQTSSTATSFTSASSRQAAKRSRANNSAVRSKRLRKQLTDTRDYTEIDSALERGAVWFYRKNVENFTSYRDFLRAVKAELVARLAEIVGNRPIKYNLKLEASYHIPRSEAPSEDRVFKTWARALLSDTDIGCAVDEDFEVMFAEEDAYSETELPPQDAFYSQLSESNIDDDDYRHATEVWNCFDCSTLGENSDLYLKIDVLLLADVFENFRDICISTYNLDPAHYYTAPGFSFDCMLKYTRMKLELLNDYDMLLMVEQGIRGGLVQAVKHYAKANNSKTPDYDPSKPESWIVYQDCNNLYGWAMSQPMLYSGFRWYKGADSLADLQSLSDTGNTGRIYEVDVSYPQELHDEHNDLPFLPVNDVPPGSKETKLMATLKPKQRYVVHYVNLKQAIAHGLQVDKVHRVLEFQQSAWLKPYIELNTEMRKKAANAFEIAFFKLMNNAVFVLNTCRFTTDSYY